MPHTAYIALGSNMGDRELNLLCAVAEIGKIPGSRITGLSGFYDTDPVGPVAQERYLNAALRLETELAPEALLAELQRIETGVFRRKRTVAWGPRPTDLDILFFDGLEMADDTLTIPHPRLHERRFVLAPLAELAPDLVHPGLGRRIDDLLVTLDSPEQVTRI